jgi:hypothetical protein
MTVRDDSFEEGSALALPLFERLAPALPLAELAARIEAATAPDDVVLDPFGRGGWTARVALALGRRALSVETSPLTRLLADVVVRPPDLRHLDAAFQSVGAAPLGTSSVRAWINEQFATRCTTCSRNVPLEELTWETPREGGDLQPVRRAFRCVACLDKRGRGNELRSAPVQPEDTARARAPLAVIDGMRDELRQRFPARGRAGAALADEVLRLHSDRQLAGLHAILVRVEGDLRASQVTSALKLALLHAILPSSRLNPARGRVGQVRIAEGHVKPPTGAGWRERNPWRAFEDGYALVRAFVQALDEGPLAAVQARVTDPLDGLMDSPPMISLRTTGGDSLDRLEAEGRALAPRDRARVRLVLGQQPPEWTPARIAEAYVLSAWALGSEAAHALPLDPLFKASARTPARSPGIRRALASLAPALGAEARADILLETEGAVSLAATALAGAAAGWRIEAARLGDPTGRPVGEVILVPPRGRIAAPARDRHGRPLAAGSGLAESLPASAGGSVTNGLPDDPRFLSADVARAVTDAAVAALQARGEPAGRDRVLGDIIVALDRSAQLARFAAVSTAVPAPDDPVVPGQLDGAGPEEGSPRSRATEIVGPTPAMVRELLDLVDRELDRPDNRRLVHLDDGRLWLGDPREEAAAAAPVSDRVEWAVFSLLSSDERMTEPMVRARIASLFTGSDEPPTRVADACIDSYAVASGTRGEVACRDELQVRVSEHARLIATLVAVGHRMRLHTTVSPREQGRRVDGQAIGALLELDEREAQLTFLPRAGAQALEEVDCLWYARPRFAFMFEVEWTAMMGDPVLRRGRRIPPDDRLVRFLVVPPERVELIRAKLAESAVLRRVFAEANWHILRSDALEQFAAQASPALDALEPFLGLDPAALNVDPQMPLFDAAPAEAASASD